MEEKLPSDRRFHHHGHECLLQKQKVSERPGWWSETAAWWVHGPYTPALVVSSPYLLSFYTTKHNQVYEYRERPSYTSTATSHSCMSRWRSSCILISTTRAHCSLMSADVNSRRKKNQTKRIGIFFLSPTAFWQNVPPTLSAGK